MLTCMIDAFEKREVSIVDKPGTLLQTKITKQEGDVQVILNGQTAEMLAKIEPET